ncbi:MAG: alpha/beta fold hydrolase [Chloroflexota bacterium]|nr:alpha/beta fold hydrolase [Chloroflexota bacterium]
MTQVPIQGEAQFIETNGVRLHVVLAGPAEGPLVVLLHGFPDFWYGWRKQIGTLAAAGYRVAVPDQRGYGRSDKPRGIGAYAVDHLAADIAGLIHALGREQAAVIGHDWGAAVAWHLALTQPACVARLGILNVPHPAVMAQQLAHNPAQLARSWYVFFFQLPALPEALFRAANYRIGVQGLVAGSRPGTFSADALHHYRHAWAQPWALTSMIHWYRAAARSLGQLPADLRVRMPALIIWGTGDAFLGREMAPASLAYCDDGRLELLEGVSHWVQDEAPDQVNALLRDFLPSPAQLNDSTRAGRAGSAASRPPHR